MRSHSSRKANLQEPQKIPLAEKILQKIPSAWSSVDQRTANLKIDQIDPTSAESQRPAAPRSSTTASKQRLCSVYAAPGLLASCVTRCSRCGVTLPLLCFLAASDGETHCSRTASKQRLCSVYAAPGLLASGVTPCFRCGVTLPPPGSTLLKSGSTLLKSGSTLLFTGSTLLSSGSTLPLPSHSL